MSLSASTASVSPHHPNTTDTRLRGRWLRLSRAMWLVVVIFTLALFVGSLPTFYMLLQPPCRSVATCNLFGSLTPEQLRTLQAAGFSAGGVAAYLFGIDMVIALIWSVVGLIIFWRRSDDWLALLVALALILFNTAQQGDPPTALAIASPAWTLPVEALSLISQASFFVLLFLFPNGRFAPRWTRWFALLYLAQTVFSLIPPAALPFDATLVSALDGIAFTSAAVAGLYSHIYRYRRISSPIQRQQIKWAVFGISTTIVLIVLLDLSNVLEINQSSPAFLIIEALFPLALLPIPLSIGVAILRYRLWDVDALINKALVYGLLTGLLGALYVGLIIGLESLAGAITGTANQPVALVISTLAIFALFLPVRRRIQSTIDRRFYRKKYDAEKTLAAFSATLRQEVDLEQIRGQLLATVYESMQPDYVTLWLRQPERLSTGQTHSPKPHVEKPGSPGLD